MVVTRICFFAFFYFVHLLWYEEMQDPGWYYVLYVLLLIMYYIIKIHGAHTCDRASHRMYGATTTSTHVWRNTLRMPKPEAQRF